MHYKGTELKKVDVNEPHPGQLPDLGTMSVADSRSLVDTLAIAMASRRNAIVRQEDDEEEEEEEEWSE